jgi:diguanylate cyclase (GGDEF)-like protein
MDDGGSDKIRERLRDLTTHFIDSLPEKLEHLRASLSQLENSAVSPDMALWDNLRNEFHRLAGTAATFNCHDISRSARELDLSMKAAGIEENGGFNSGYYGKLWKLYNNLITVYNNIRSGVPDEIALLEEEPLPAPKAAAAKIKQDYARYLCLYKSEFFFSEESIDQLKVFGYSIVSVENLDSVEQFLRERKTVILVLNAGNFQNEPENLRRMNAMCDTEYKEQLRVLYVCEWDNFDTRLFAVRNHGEAFVPVPFDIPYLIDKIDSLFHNNEQEPYHILIVDDDPEQVSFYAMVLQNAGMITSVALDSRNVIGILIESKPDLILMDLYMPECSGLELAALIRQQEAFIGIPVVFFSVEQDMKTQLEAVQHGADDFLVKPILPEHLTASLAVRVERNRRLRYFMERDSLTGLYNHSQLQKRLADDLNRSRRIGSRTCYAMIDIDHFKLVNDQYGHLTGDRVIKALSQLLLERLRKTDTVGRYGGEEFGVILFNTDLNSGETLMNEIRESFSRIHHKEAKNDFVVTFSCGITEARSDEALVVIKEQADKALYSAKRNGRNRVERFLDT